MIASIDHNNDQRDCDLLKQSTVAERGFQQRQVYIVRTSPAFAHVSYSSLHRHLVDTSPTSAARGCLIRVADAVAVANSLYFSLLKSQLAL